MTVRTIKQAWNEANKLMPCDYMHDSTRSKNAGYDIYFSTCVSKVCWISDLGDRLEVNLPNGDSINIWIEDEETETTNDSTETTQDSENTTENGTDAAEVAEYITDANAIKNGKYEALYAPTVGQMVTVCISGDTYATEAERAVYEALKHDHIGAVGEIIAEWCNQHGVVWGSISHSQKMHVDHKNGSGHYVVSAFVSARIGHEIGFLHQCSALLLDSYKEHLDRSAAMMGGD